MAGGQLAAVYDARKGEGIDDATDQIFHTLRHDVAGGKDIPEVQWRIIRNKFLRLLLHTSWTYHGPLRQLSNLVETAIYHNPPLLFPLMRTALNSTREAGNFPRNTERKVYNISNLDLIRTMQPVVQQATKKGVTERPTNIPNLDDDGYLSKFLGYSEWLHNDFITVYMGMYTQWKANKLGEAPQPMDDEDLEDLAVKYIKRSYSRVTRGLQSQFTERSFVGAIYGFVTVASISFHSVRFSNEAGPLFWDMYAMRYLVEEFANDALGKNAATDLWVDGISLPTGPLIPRPPNHPWSKSVDEILKQDYTDEQRGIISNVNSSLVGFHKASQKLKMNTLPKPRQVLLNSIFEEASQVRCCLHAALFIQKIVTANLALAFVGQIWTD